MTVSEWEGTSWSGTAVAAPEAGNVVRMLPAKAATGWEGIYTATQPPASYFSRSPLRRMREDQAAYWVNPWILVAENAVTRRVRGLPWHLEDGRDDTVDDTANPVLKAIASVLEKPQAALPVEQRQVGLNSWTNLISVTSRHLGLCGMTHWYLDSMNDAGEPAAILYVNPARLYPKTTTSGHLVFWVLDPADDEGRIGPASQILRRDEVLTFYLTPPDGGAIVTGLVHAARTKTAVTGVADLHALGVLGSGGQIAGIVSPKEGTIQDEQYEVLNRELRNIQESPNSAKRLAVLRGPVDLHPTAANMQELDLTGIAEMNRNDILTIWGVPQSQAPVAVPAGLNSGDTKKYDEAVLFQGAVHDRIVPITETIQLELLDRYAARPQLVIEEPSFDDEAPAYELAAKAKEQPLTRNERRAILKLDPLPDYGPDGEPLGLAIDLPALLVTVGQGEDTPGAAPGNFTVAPEPPQATVLPPIMPPALPANVPEPAKAGGLPRAAVIRRFEPVIRRAVADLLAEQKREIAARVRDRGGHISRKRSDTRVWWDEGKWNAKLADALKRGAAGVASVVAGKVNAHFGNAKATFEESIAESVLRAIALRVKGINQTTRDAIAELIGRGFDDGLSPAQVADLIEEATAFDAARAEVIARTESARAYNDAALESYREYEVTRVQAIDGDEDEECAQRDGQVFDIDEALTIEDHPNGTLDWVPA